MENLKVMRTVGGDNRPSFNDWCKELKVSSQYIDVNRMEPILRQSVKEQYSVTIWERIGRRLGL